MRSSMQRSWLTSARIRRRCRPPSLVIPSPFSPPFSPSPQLLPTTPFSQSQKLQLGLDSGKIRACSSVNPGCVSTDPVGPLLDELVAAAGVFVTPAASFIPPSNLSAGSPPADNGSIPLNLISPPPFLPLVAAADATATPVASFNPSTGSPQVNGASVMKSTQRPLLPKSAEPNKVLAPPAQCSSGNKRRASRSAPKAATPKKIPCQTNKVSSVKGGKRSTSQAAEISKAKEWPQNKRSTSQLCCVVGHPKLAVSKGLMGEPERTPDVIVPLVSNSVLF